MAIKLIRGDGVWKIIGYGVLSESDDLGWAALDAYSSLNDTVLRSSSEKTCRQTHSNAGARVGSSSKYRGDREGSRPIFDKPGGE